jgi:hypothetical protein
MLPFFYLNLNSAFKSFPLELASGLLNLQTATAICSSSPGALYPSKQSWDLSHIYFHQFAIYSKLFSFLVVGFFWDGLSLHKSTSLFSLVTLSGLCRTYAFSPNRG